MSDKEILIDVNHMTETDRLIKKLDFIITSIKGKEEKFDFKIVKDNFEKQRLQLLDKLNEAETLLNERDKIFNSKQPKDIYEKKNLEKKAEVLLDLIDNQVKDLDVELKAQKKKQGKYGNFTNKEDMVNLISQKYQLLRSKLDGIEINEQEVRDNRSHLEQLDDILKKQSGGAQKERELYEEEKQKMEEWKKEVEEQDKDLEDVGNAVKQLRVEVKNAGKKLSDINKTVKKVSAHTDSTNTKVVSTNKQLKDLLAKLRSGDKFCMDIILILIVIGLIVVLYSIIKNKFIKK